MKFLIYGGKGWIGSQFVDLLMLNPFTYDFTIGKSRLYNIEDVIN